MLEAVALVPVGLERPADPEHGDYATGVALKLAKQRGKPPRELAEELGWAVEALPEVERAEVAGPGFVNVFLRPAWFGAALAEALEPGFGGGSAAPVERVQVEMVSANPTGPLTVASARNGAYGDSVARLLAFAGHEVEREYYYNDAGAQMDRFRESVEARRRGEEPPADGYFGAYVDELAAEPGDPVPRMLASIEATLERQNGRRIPMNIDGATAVIYSELGFSPALGRGLFILSRSVGILAHAWEQSRQGGRIKGPMTPEIPFKYSGPPLRAVPR